MSAKQTYLPADVAWAAYRGAPSRVVYRTAPVATRAAYGEAKDIAPEAQETRQEEA